MPIKSAMEYRGLHPGVLMPVVRAAVKSANAEVVERWHGEMLPEHFTVGADTVYRYRSRSAAYERAKPRLQRRMNLPRHGLDRGVDLVFSGEGARRAMRSVRVSGTSKGARGTFEGRVFNFRRLSRELVRTTRAEERDLAAGHERSVAARLNAVSSTRKVEG